MAVSPPTPRIPSLNALRAFEAAARLGGFALAAEELGVTPGAVAAQIKSLEEEIGAALFVRNARGVALTPIGRRALPGFVDVFDRLATAVHELRQDAAPHKVHIAALPALAQLWLAPRLPGLRNSLPGVDISVTALETPPNLKRVPFDICLFYSDEIRSDDVWTEADALLPVCAPELAETLTRPGELKSAVCLTDATWKDDWRLWAASAMPGEDFVPKGPVYSLYAVAVEEALNGAGVLMAHRSLVEGHLRSGRLVAPFTQTVPLTQKISMWIQPGTRIPEILENIIDNLTKEHR
ncbi:LysR family transcriptional regulator [Roseibium sp.]|uniref:LysR family transcriptional regulator n=1 Tax=Roseibium sp. TaxID=1936156 RepID=UPI003B5092C2